MSTYPHFRVHLHSAFVSLPPYSHVRVDSYYIDRQTFFTDFDYLYNFASCFFVILNIVTLNFFLRVVAFKLLCFKDFIYGFTLYSPIVINLPDVRTGLCECTLMQVF